MKKKIVLLKHKNQEIYPVTYSLAIIHKGELLYDFLENIPQPIASDFDIKDLSDVTGLRELWNGKQDTLIAGDGIEFSGLTINVIGKQDTLTAGNNITIDDSGLISAIDTTYVASDFDIKDLADSNGLRTTWSNKQNAISDLSLIRSGALLGTTSLQPNSLKTINNESLVGSGNIEIHGQNLIPGNAISIEDAANSTEKIISVNSHVYDEKNNNCLFGYENQIGINEIEFLGYIKSCDHSQDFMYDFTDEDLIFCKNSTGNKKFQYSILTEINENPSTGMPDILNIVGSLLYLDDSCETCLGKIVNAAKLNDSNRRIYISLDSTEYGRIENYTSTWIGFGIPENSLAQGSFNIIKNANAHAEGKDTEASGAQSHSEGEFTNAEGINSHAEGQYTTTFGTASHAEGEGGQITLFRTRLAIDNSPIILLTRNSHGDSDFGSDSAYCFFAGSDYASDFATSMSDSDGIPNIYDIEKGNKINGWIGRSIYKSNGDLIGIICEIDGIALTITIDRNTTLALNEAIYIKSGAFGENSHTEGYLTDAPGVASHAEGERTQATGTNAHAEGFKSRAFGRNSHAEGYGTAAYTFGSHAEGKQTQVEGEYSHTEGYDTKASGNFAHAEGKSSSAQGLYSHAEGYNTTTDGNTYWEDCEIEFTVIDVSEDGVAVDTTIRLDTNSVYKCRNTRYNTFYLHSCEIINNIIIPGEHGHISKIERAIVGNTYHLYKEQYTVAAHAEGKDTVAAETASHAEGINTRADADAAHSEGIDSKSLSRGGHAEGINTFVNEHAEGSHTEGKETQVLTDYAHAEGYKTVVNRSDSKTGENKWNTWGGHAEGGETLVEGTFAHAEGEHTKALNRGSHAEGFKTEAHEKYSHAEGWYTKATHKGEHAQGRCNKSNDIHVNTTVEYVDLDLPSGNLWATCNIGAENPEEYGDYYAWGEIETKNNYDWNTYKWCNGSNVELTKYCSNANYWNGSTPNPDKLTRLLYEDDIVSKTLGNNWRIPSKKDFNELVTKTTQEWTTINGVYGCKFTHNNKFIFLPAAGAKIGSTSDSVGEEGYYASLLFVKTSNNEVSILLINEGGSYTDSKDRCVGISIRPVSSKLQTIYSVGVGESDGDHRNAIEITTDGNIFIKGVGNFDGGNIQSAQSLQLLLLLGGSGESGLSPETAIVIAAALNDLNDRLARLEIIQP